MGVILYNGNAYETSDDSFDSASLPELNQLKPNVCYYDIRDAHFWLYSHEKPSNACRIPNVWVEDGQYVKSEPFEDTLQQFTKKNVLRVSLNDILEKAKTSEGPHYDAETVGEMIRSASDVFRPVINPGDDFLKRAIKSFFISVPNGIVVAKYKRATAKREMLANMMSALNGKTKMSPFYFSRWSELFKFRFMLIITNSDESKEVIPKPLVVFSDREKVYTLDECEFDESGLPIPKK